MKSTFFTIASSSNISQLYILKTSLNYILPNTNIDFHIQSLNLSSNDITELQRIGCIVHTDMNTIVHPYRSKNSPSNTFNMLNAWTLTEYDRVCILHTDSLFLNDPSSIFNFPLISDDHIAAVEDPISYSSHNKIGNTGLLLLKPNLTTYNNLLESIGYITCYDHTVQGFLNTFFKTKYINCLSIMPSNYNYYIQYYQTSRHQNISNIILIHFKGNWKPWIPTLNYQFKYSFFLSYWQQIQTLYQSLPSTSITESVIEEPIIEESVIESEPVIEEVIVEPIIEEVIVEPDWSILTDDEYLNIIFREYNISTGPLYWRGGPILPGYSEGLSFETMSTVVILGDTIDRQFIMTLMEFIYKTNIMIIKLNTRRRKIVDEWLRVKVRLIEPIGTSYVIVFVK